MEDTFTKPEPLPRPKKSFYQKPIASPKLRKSARSPIDISSRDKSEEKEVLKTRPFAKNILRMIG